MKQVISRFLGDSAGSAMMEYSLIAAIIAINILLAVSSLSETLENVFQTIISGLTSIGNRH